MKKPNKIILVDIIMLIIGVLGLIIFLGVLFQWGVEKPKPRDITSIVIISVFLVYTAITVVANVLTLLLDIKNLKK